VLQTSQKRKFSTLAQLKIKKILSLAELKIEILCSGLTKWGYLCSSGLKIENTIAGSVKNRNSVLRPVKNSRSVLRQSLTHRRAAVVRDSIVLGRSTGNHHGTVY